MQQNSNNRLLRRFGAAPDSYFFGYYNKTPWDVADRFLLAHRTPLRGGALSGIEIAQIGYFDTEGSAEFCPFAETQAWNWQMGAQLQWLGDKPRQVIFNFRLANGLDRAFGTPYAGRILNIETGDSKDLPLPIYVLNREGTEAFCINYSRLAHTHPTIGYGAQTRSAVPSLCPEDDGLFRMNVESSQFEQLLSFSQLAKVDPKESMQGAVHWISHVEVAPNGARLLFLHRWTKRVEDETCFVHRLFTCGVDGSDLRLLECTDHPLPQLEEVFDADALGIFDYEKSEYQISHPMWVDNERVIVWGPHAGHIGYHMYKDKGGSVKRIGEGTLVENGHMSFAPQGKLMVTDTYPDPDTHERELFLWDDERDEKRSLGFFKTRPDLQKVDRCDLHPRWNRAGDQISFDSVHEGERALYTIEIEAGGLRQTSAAAVSNKSGLIGAGL